MPADMKKLVQDKDIIVSTIQTKGPSLPVHVARAANLSILFASAYLSELYGEKRIKMSHMRVGSSPLYFLEGQEAQLENFIQYLAPKEKEAFLILKKEKILNDEKLPPPIRVALRELKDFAIPLKVRIQEESKLFWKHFLVADKDANDLLIELFSPPSKKKEKVASSPLPQTTPVTTTQQLLEQASPLILKKRTRKATQKKPKTEDIAFANKIKEYLLAKNIEILSILQTKKKECALKIRLDTSLGKQEFYLIAKDKKKITEEDLAVAIHKAQAEKMPAFFLTSGTLDAEADNFFKLWKNLIKLEKLKL